jgi:hypothetical protein
LPCKECMDLLFDKLSVDNLNALLGLHGHQVAIGMLKNKGVMVAWWQRIVASMNPPLTFARWMDEDKAQLQVVMSDDVDIMDTQFGRLVMLQERELEAMLEEMTQGKRDAIRRRLNKMLTDLKAPSTSMQLGELAASTMSSLTA